MSIEKLHDLIRDELHGGPIRTDTGPWPIDDDAACEIADVLGPKLADLIRTELTGNDVVEAAAIAMLRADCGADAAFVTRHDRTVARAALEAVATTLGDHQ